MEKIKQAIEILETPFDTRPHWVIANLLKEVLIELEERWIPVSEPPKIAPHPLWKNQLYSDSVLVYSDWGITIGEYSEPKKGYEELYNPRWEENLELIEGALFWMPLPLPPSPNK